MMLWLKQPSKACWPTSNLFLIDKPMSILATAISIHLFTMHQRMATINVSRFSLIDMPILMLVAPLPRIPLSISHHRKAIINVSSSFLIDKPISMLVIPTATCLSISHH